MNFGQIQLFLSDGAKAGEIQGNRHSVRGADQTITCVNKSYHAVNPKKRISIISSGDIERVKAAFSGRAVHKEPKTNNTQVARYEKLSSSSKSKMKISSVLEAVNIKVRNRQCCCPFHDDKNPSMSVSDEKGVVYCFACAEGYNVITLYRALKKAGKL